MTMVNPQYDTIEEILFETLLHRKAERLLKKEDQGKKSGTLLTDLVREAEKSSSVDYASLLTKHGLQEREDIGTILEDYVRKRQDILGFGTREFSTIPYPKYWSIPGFVVSLLGGTALGGGVALLSYAAVSMAYPIVTALIGLGMGSSFGLLTEVISQPSANLITAMKRRVAARSHLKDYSSLYRTTADQLHKAITGPA